jgi:predicted phage terminase large subunit-like protein
MRPEFNEVLREDFHSFLKKAFRVAHGEKLGTQPYLTYISFHLSKIRTGEERFFLINLPPQHLKTFCSTCLIAWYLGHYPKRRVLLVGYSDEHAKTISRQIREVMNSHWYGTVFSARISRQVSSASNFETTEGGGVYAVSANGSVTGRRADLIVYDDPLQIGDCNDLDLMENINARFDSVIMSRLSNPAKGAVVIVAHRLHENDISGHVLKQGGYRHICLPLIAPRKERYTMGDETWTRAKGDLLRPDQYSAKDIKRVRQVANPDFETFYQQNPGGGSSITIKREYIQVVSLHLPPLPIVLSVDAGHGSLSGRSSFSVIQKWSPFEGEHALIDQFRERCGFDELWSALKRFAKRRPAAILVENAAYGRALIERAKRFHRYNVIPVDLDGRSKIERLAPHMKLIRKRGIVIPAAAEWGEDYVQEMMAFPNGPSDDQVDATTQYLDFMAQNPTLERPPEAGLGAVSVSRLYWGPPLVGIRH